MLALPTKLLVYNFSVKFTYYKTNYLHVVWRIWQNTKSMKLEKKTSSLDLVHLKAVILKELCHYTEILISNFYLSPKHYLEI